MENRQQQILAEIQSMMASIRNELNLLDAKISEFQQIADESGSHLEPIDLEPINLLEPDVEFVAEPQVTPSEEPVVEEPVIEEPVVEDLPDDDLPFFEEEPVKTSPAPIIDTMTDRQAWRTDMPGGAVKDVRSAISLNDRILFINKLFDEDPMAFQTAIGRINSMESLPEVIDYVHAEHSDWNLESDTVYRFMMAVRRKVR
jgi:hypothetical protein